MDTLFGIPMVNILEHMPVADEVRGALIAREGAFGDMLHLVEYLERMQDSGVHAIPAFERLQLSNEELAAMQVAAFEWSDSVARGA